MAYICKKLHPDGIYKITRFAVVDLGLHKNVMALRIGRIFKLLMTKFNTLEKPEVPNSKTGSPVLTNRNMSKIIEIKCLTS